MWTDGHTTPKLYPSDFVGGINILTLLISNMSSVSSSYIFIFIVPNRKRPFSIFGILVDTFLFPPPNFK